VAGLLLVVLGIALARGIGNRDGSTESTVSEAPAFSLPAFDGTTFSLSEHAGQPVLVYFWASWCEPCKTEAPLIQRLWEQEYRDRGYLFVGVNIWDGSKEAQEFAKDNGLTFPVVRDQENKLYLDFGVESLPMAFFLRPGLEVDRRYLGELNEDDLRKMLDRLETPA
jgi:cytochrome c biogenesis protein CcmG/thiol:disulfide interchange protein DsbE